MPSTKTLNQSPTISAVENADLLWIWDSSASELNKISRTNLLTTTDDFNTSYARLDGRSGGQTLIGGTAANDDLTLEGTSNATRTTSYVVLQPNGGNVGIGSVLPLGTKFRVSDGTASETIISVFEGTTAKTWNGTNITESIRLRSTFTGEASSLDTARITWGYSTNLPAGGSRFGIDTINASGNYANVITITGTGNVGIGTTSPDTRLDIDAGAIEFAEMTAPAAGAVNTGRLFCRDNGSGKTQLCIIFNTGAIQVIATQP